MGQLKEGASYVYESPDGGDTVYSREIGSTERTLVGISLGRQKRNKELQDTQLWHDIRQEAEHNETLQKALEQCIILYHISKNGR